MNNKYSKPKFAGLLSRAMSGLWADVQIVAAAIRHWSEKADESRLNYRAFREKWIYRPPISPTEWRVFWREFFDLEGAEDDRARDLMRLSTKLGMAHEKAKEIIANNDRGLEPDVFAAIGRDIAQLVGILNEANALYSSVIDKEK